MSVQVNNQQRWRNRKAWFVVSQAIFLPAIASAAMVSHYRLDQSRHLPLLAETPRQVRPLHDCPEIVTDEQLFRVLAKLEPRLGRERPKVNHVDHALRFWGLSSQFQNADSINGNDMYRMLTDDHSFQAFWGVGVRPLLVQKQQRLNVRVQEGVASSSHTDHTLATLLEIGTSLNSELTTREGAFCVRDLMESSLRQFNLSQTEYEWSVLALLLCAAERPHWNTLEGQQISIDRLLRRVMRQPLGFGCCYGGHRLYTLTIALRVDAETGWMSPATRELVETHLRDATQQLVATQSPQGYWDEAWAGPRDTSDDNLSPQGRRLLATGHALEWWAMAPVELHPPREVLVRAGQWLVREIEMMEPSTGLMKMDGSGRIR